jgi:hypothetical protein
MVSKTSDRPLLASLCGQALHPGNGVGLSQPARLLLRLLRRVGDAVVVVSGGL